MNLYRVVLLAFLALSSIPSTGFSQEAPSLESTASEPNVPTPEAPANYQQSNENNYANMVILQGLNKITARTLMFEIPLHSAVRFGNLEVRLENCWKSSPEEKPESAALLQVWEQKPGEEKKQIFFGWMFSSSPSISSIEHSVYDLSVIQCRNTNQKEEVPPTPPASENLYQEEVPSEEVRPED